MNDFFDSGGVFLRGFIVRSSEGQDLGEYGDAGGSGVGAVASERIAAFPSEFTTSGTYWGRLLGVISPSNAGDKLAIGASSTLYDEKVRVVGKILATGLMLSDAVSISKDGSNNMVFTDAVSGSKTLAELLAGATGDVIAVGTPTNLQLAQWTDDKHIQGIAISTLGLAQSQITGLVTALTNKASKVHNLIDTTNHPVSGLTAGQFLKALSPTSYGFSAHGLTKSDIALGNVTNDAQVKKISSSTNLAIARWDGASGALLKDSLATIDDAGSVNIPAGQHYKINGIPIVSYTIPPFGVVTYANPLTLNGTQYKDFKCASITGDTVVNLTGVNDGEAGQIILVIDSTGGYDVQLGEMFTKRLGSGTIVTTANADNTISWRKDGSDIRYTILQAS